MAGDLSKCRVRVHARLGCLERNSDFGLHLWGSAVEVDTSWENPLKRIGEDWFGPYFDIELLPVVADADPVVGMLLHAGDDKRATCSMNTAKDLPKDGSEIWFGHMPHATQVEPGRDAVPVGDLSTRGARAHWLSARQIAWRAAGVCPEGSRFFLCTSRTASLSDEGTKGIGNQDSDAGGPHELKLIAKCLGSDLASAHPYLAACALLSIPETVDPRKLCCRQLAVCAVGPNGNAIDCSGVQVGALLDELFSYAGPLGCHPARDALPSSGACLALWAPTAITVEVTLYEGPRGDVLETVPMRRESGQDDDGVWRIVGPEAWWGKYYTYTVEAYHQEVGHFVKMKTPDPYCCACAANAERSLIEYLPTLSEAVPCEDRMAWLSHPVPAFSDRCAAVIYELHVRDFSASDASVPEDLRGKYLAFELKDTIGDKHLRRLAAAGITHVQLLPTYDFGSVPERQADRTEPMIARGALPDSEEQQAAVVEVADADAFNWGYDPVLFNVPEGSYATSADGFLRVKEHRRMVMALHAKGLRVVLDVVYNHTHGSGPTGSLSVLDKCVPGYYHRRSEHGAYEHSTCMNNTAAERAMMERLIVDSLLHWVLEYRVDGFRFDLMGHLPLRCLQRCRAALDALSLEVHGVDGPRILLYGEGWEFGEVAGGQRGTVAIQHALPGTGIGAFNDRVRDAALGGSPFVDPRIQGFITGLSFRSEDEGRRPMQRRNLLIAADKIRVSLAASLKEFCLSEDCDGNANVRAFDIHGGGVAYTVAPVEALNYVSAHDNETLYDNTVWKMSPSIFSPDERMRANWLGSALIALSHGVPFFHAGDEVLRSKSLDRDSYNSGDWFNVLDFTGLQSGFGRGLPPASKNQGHWELMRPLLRDLLLKPSTFMVEATTAKFCELLEIRKSTPLIGLCCAEDILEKVDFPACGAAQIPGIIIMQTRNGQPATASEPAPLLCPNVARVVIVFSARFEASRVLAPIGAAGSLPLRLHPLQAASSDSLTRSASFDEVSGELVIPPQAASVFIEPLPGREAWAGR